MSVTSIYGNAAEQAEAVVTQAAEASKQADSIATDNVVTLRTIPMSYATLDIDAPFTIEKGKNAGSKATRDMVWAKMGSALHSLRPQENARIVIAYDRAVAGTDTVETVVRKVLLVSVVTTDAGRYGTKITVKMARQDGQYDTRTFIVAQLRSLSYPARRA
jgi:hypothetical protein